MTDTGMIIAAFLTDVNQASVTCGFKTLISNMSVRDNFTWFRGIGLFHFF